MRAFNIFLIILATLACAALGFFLLGLAAHPPLLDLVSDGQALLQDAAFGRGRWLLALAGLGAALLAFYSFWGNVATRRYERTVVFHNPHGEVMIALGALEDLGKAVKAEISGLKEIRLRVKARRKGLQVTARVALWSDASLPKTTELIQESIRHYLQEVVGSDQEIRPRVVVSKVAFRGPEEYENGEGGRRRARRPEA